MEKIKINSRSNFELKANSTSKMNKIILLQIINLICIVYFIILFTKKTKNIYNNNKPKLDKSSKRTIYDKIRLLKILTNNDVREYKGMMECLLNDPDEKFCIYHLISTKLIIGKNHILLGEKGDGCYVLLDDFENVKIAYSFGIGGNIHFDRELADRGIDVYMYDHTINSLPIQNPKFHWKKIGICGVGKKYENLKNLEELIVENGHTNQKNMILKIDVEHWEFESILYLKEDTLKNLNILPLNIVSKLKNFIIIIK